MAQRRRQMSNNALSIRTLALKSSDSPSRQLISEMEKALGQVQIHEVELQKVHAYDRRAFYEGLERIDHERMQNDQARLDAATARHEAVRRDAEAELEQYYRQVEELQRLQKEKEERALREKLAREKAERERQQREEAERRAKIEEEKAAAAAAAAAKKAAEEKAKADAAAAMRREREETATREKAAREKEEKERAEAARAAKRQVEEKAAQDALARQVEAEKKTQAAQQFPPPSSGADARHQRYLSIHQHLKQFRKEFWSQCKSNPTLKARVGEMRRAMKTSVGQLTEAKGANKQPTERVRSTLKDALGIESSSVDIRDFFAETPPECQTPEDSQAPGLLIYLLNIFSKAVISQFVGESAVSAKAAEPAGVLVAQIFSSEDFLYRGRSMIDVLLAKFHFVCPVLWGIYGDEATSAGKIRLGWRREEGRFVTDQRHTERMSGLGAGFAAIALRNFSKARLQNPFPPTNYWECLANIVNVAPQEVQLTHLAVLKTMIENSADRFVLFFDGLAIAALREALMDFPSRLPAEKRGSSACKAVILLAESLRMERNLSLV